MEGFGDNPEDAEYPADPCCESEEGVGTVHYPLDQVDHAEEQDQTRQDVHREDPVLDDKLPLVLAHEVEKHIDDEEDG